MTNLPDSKSREAANALWEILEGFFEEELYELIAGWMETHPE